MTNYERALDSVVEAVRKRVPACVTHLAVHGLVEANKDEGFRSTLNSFEIVAPDGQPVRLALNLLGDAKLADRCYGPEFMIRVCQRASIEGIGLYLYGSHPNVVKALGHNLVNRFPGLRIVGREPSIFRPLTQKEDNELTDRINESGADVVFVGLGCPLQEKFAYNHRKRSMQSRFAWEPHLTFILATRKWLQRGCNGYRWSGFSGYVRSPAGCGEGTCSRIPYFCQRSFCSCLDSESIDHYYCDAEPLEVWK